jgi:hypothetical protein
MNYNYQDFDDEDISYNEKHYRKIDTLKANDLIRFKFFYENCSPRYGIVIKIEDDPGFYKILHIVSEGTIEIFPGSILDFEIIV